MGGAKELGMVYINIIRGAKEPRNLQNHRGVNSFGFVWYYSPPEVDRIWGIWGSYYKKPKAIFYLLQGDYTLSPKP